MQNHLKNETSPYLLQHVNNPVNWYPWCEEAFQKAKAEDKPIFLSIGYSTCHWCHVMAHESFEDKEIAEILNKHFISIKVDKEERPDIDSIYMSVCQALTGSGGWPTSIFITPEQKPFFAGTYFPKYSRYGQIGFEQLLTIIAEKWKTDRKTLLDSAEEIVSFLKGQELRESEENTKTDNDFIKKGYISKKVIEADIRLTDTAVEIYKRTFDKTYGGFGDAPKFPTPHNLLFLMRYTEKSNNNSIFSMVEKTLQQMYLGGIFDHIGGGFSRYSTDKYFLAPHFEKMLYDNALLIMVYSKAYQMTQNILYLEVAEQTANYVLREMTYKEGGFYSAQDADSEGVEGKYYLFTPKEIIEVLGEIRGKAFNKYFDVTEEGNFEGKNILNLLNQEIDDIINTLNESNTNKNTFDTKKSQDFNIDNIKITEWSRLFGEEKLKLYEYRKKRHSLHLDDKILTAWNGLMISAMCQLYRVTGKEIYLDTAKKAQYFIESNLSDKKITLELFVSYRDGKHGAKGFLDDYANEIFALLSLYEATLEKVYLEKAEYFCKKVCVEFYDKKQHGFFLYGKENEHLILRPKEIYDGAVPSGNSMMAYNLVQLFHITRKEKYKQLAKEQLDFISKEAIRYPAGYAMFLIALLDFFDEPNTITIVEKEKQDLRGIACKIPLHTIIRILEEPTEEYALKNNKTTYYICEGRSCKPPVNQLNGIK